MLRGNNKTQHIKFVRFTHRTTIKFSVSRIIYKFNFYAIILRGKWYNVKSLKYFIINIDIIHKYFSAISKKLLLTLKYWVH